MKDAGDNAAVEKRHDYQNGNALNFTCQQKRTVDRLDVTAVDSPIKDLGVDQVMAAGLSTFKDIERPWCLKSFRKVED